MIIGPAIGFTPRPYQEWAIDGGAPHLGPGIMPCFARYQRVMAVLATGLGKTEVFLSLARRYLSSPKTPAGKRVLILAHRDELVSQPIERAPRFGLAIAREQGTSSGVGRMERVVASTIQSMTANSATTAARSIGFKFPKPELTPAEKATAIIHALCKADFKSGHPFPSDIHIDTWLMQAGRSDPQQGWPHPKQAVVDAITLLGKAEAAIIHHVEYQRLVTKTPKAQGPKREPRFPSVAPDGAVWPDLTLAEFTARFKLEHPRVPTMRCEKYDPDEIGLIVIDECHHGVSDDYQTLVSRFPNAYVLGVTATFERLDGIALGEAFEAVAFEYNIEAGSDDGWLVPVVPHEVQIDGLDISKMRSRMGDLPPGPLGELLAEYAMPVAKHIVELAGDRPTIVFCATVAHAHAQAAAIRRELADRGIDARVESADGGTDKGLRADIVTDFREGRVRYLVNAMLYTEGFDAPNARCVAMVRPTKSRSLLIQAVGRGTRPEPGCVDKPHLRDDPAGRRAAIAASSKPDVLVLDFCAQVEQIGLVSVADALAGKLTPEERLMLGKIDIVGTMKIDAIAAEARRLAAEEAVRLAALSDAEATAREVDPFNPAAVLRIKDMPRNDPNEARCSDKMAIMLTGKGIAAAEHLSVSQAKKLAGALAMRAKFNFCSYRQALALQKAGVPAATCSRMSFETASRLMTNLTNNGWRRPKEWESEPKLGGRAPVKAMVVPPLDLPRAG